jgi:hypothetical protein
MKWITASRLEQWAALPTSALDLPDMVSDLIRASATDINAIRFPSGEKGQVRGFDGHLANADAALNVPQGHSFWEFGTEKNYKAKASADFKKRSRQVAVTLRKTSTFVFVTPWTWDSSKSDNKLEDWIDARSGEYAWKEILYLDGVTLETWFQACPATAAWHARNTIKCTPVAGARSTDEFWREFADRFNPRITEDVLLCERQRENDQLVNALMASSGSISLSADSPDEVIAFAVAAIRKAKPEVRLFLEARTIVVDSMAAGRELLTESNLVYLLRDDAARTPGQFAERGPTLVALGRQQRTGVAQPLNRPSGYAMGMAITTMGVSENQAITLARGCGRSLTALARQIPSGSYEPPPWLKESSIVLPAILAGGWDASNDLDKAIVQTLAGTANYFVYEGKLRRFLSEADPPLDQEGTVWKVRAPMDAFIHVGHLIGPEHIESLRSVMSAVFSRIEADPDPDEIVQLSRPPDPAYSEWLKDGLATTLLLIAVWDKQAELRLGIGAGQRFANELIGGLPGLTTNHRLLASLRDELPLLAEAAPDPLLAALERMLEGDGRAIHPLFDEPEGLLFPRVRHTGLLRALETLAWDPDYFDRAVMILAGLAAIDPGGRVGNRPSKSLGEIFVLWNPNTNASASQRMAALDEIIRVVPQVGWTLICGLLPTIHGVSSPTSRPRLRETGASERSAVTYGELWQSESDVVRRAIQLAGHDPARWSQVISKIATFPPEVRASAVSALNATFASLGDKERQSLWSRLRDEVARHEQFSTAKWALQADQLAPLRSLVDRYAPPDPISGVAWLFDTWTLDATGDTKEADRRRAEALQDLLAKHGLDAVLRLGIETKLPDVVVETLAAVDTSRGDIETLLVKTLRANPESNFAVCLAWLHLRIVGEERAAAWLISEMTVNGWSAEVVARLLIGWPDQTSTWHVARRFGENVVAAYWAMKRARWLNGSKRELIRAELNFLRYGRAVAALKSALNRLQELPAKLLLRLLDGIVQELNERRSAVDSMMTYELEQAFGELDRREDISDLAIAQREFAFLALFDGSNRTLRIHKLMASDPDLYHQVLRQVFAGDDDARSEPNEAAQANWRLNYSLLSKFTQLPGQNGDEMEVGVLSRWIDRVRELGAETGRVEITDQYLGHVLAHAVRDVDGNWPHRAVREQIERLRSSELERGIQIERFNMRGPHWRALYDGGKQERALAAEYYRSADLMAPWPRTAALLKAIARNWEVDGEREDVRANQRKLRS